MADKAAQPTSSVTLIGAHSSVRKADTSALILNGTEAYPDDSFGGQYAGGSVGNGVAILEPTYKPGVLYALTTQNNILLQCIEAMEVNIDGTGHSIDQLDEGKENEAEKTMLEDFFKEPYPGKSMVSVRRAIRRDVEATGNGYMEVIRNAADEVLLINHLDCNYTRLVRLDDPATVTRTIRRGGKDIEVNLRMRERRFVQIVNGLDRKVYFKEFGVSRDLNRDTGEWAPQGTRLPLEQRASEVIHFVGNKEPKTAYGTPRWANQMPSVLGSRKAEEHNLEFFDAGGVPPMMIIVQGGSLGTGVKEAITGHMSSKGNKHRAAVIEAVSTSGSIDSAGTVQVRVERFGAERQQDAMFQKYDMECGEHVRVAFRLPPLFLGKAADYNFATAYTTYMIAEAQVFQPERDEFDNVINATIVKALGAKDYRFRSLPMTLTDVQTQMKALELVVGKFVSGEDFIKKLNEMTGLGLEYEKQEEPVPPMVPGVPGMVPPAAAVPGKDPAEEALGNNGTNTQVGKSEDDPYLMELADRLCEYAEMGAQVWKGADQIVLRKAISDLPNDDFVAFSKILASRSVELVQLTDAGVEELCACAEHM